jgi:hypothetical protein
MSDERMSRIELKKKLHGLVDSWVNELPEVVSVEDGDERSIEFSVESGYDSGNDAHYYSVCQEKKARENNVI